MLCELFPSPSLKARGQYNEKLRLRKFTIKQLRNFTFSCPIRASGDERGYVKASCFNSLSDSVNTWNRIWERVLRKPFLGCLGTLWPLPVCHNLQNQTLQKSYQNRKFFDFFRVLKAVKLSLFKLPLFFQHRSNLYYSNFP